MDIGRQTPASNSISRGKRQGFVSARASRLYHRARYEFLTRLPLPMRHYVQFFIHFGHFPNVRNPRTFNEKVLHKMHRDRRDFIKIAEDKYSSRNYVQEKLGSSINFSKLYGAYDHASEIHLENLPSEFVMKASYGSGWVKVYKSGDPRLIEEIRERAQSWLDWRFPKLSETWYCSKSRQRILIEELILENGDVPTDYKFHCFDGKPEIVEVMTGRFAEKKYSAYDMNWNRIEAWSSGWKNHSYGLKRPRGLALMQEIARKLSEGNDYVRVDLYDIEGKVYFGELTNFPADGIDRFTLDKRLGKLWTLPHRYE